MTDMTAGAPKRPTLLTVICILSFLAGAFGLWDGYKNAFTEKPQQEMEEAKAKMQESIEQMGPDAAANPLVSEMMESSMSMMEKASENARPMGYAGIVLSLLSLAGVWLMWNLKKNGFWLYLLASIGGLITPLVFMGGGLLAILSVGFVGLITIVFIILYAVNLKHMH